MEGSGTILACMLNLENRSLPSPVLMIFNFVLKLLIGFYQVNRVRCPQRKPNNYIEYDHVKIFCYCTCLNKNKMFDSVVINSKP